MKTNCWQFQTRVFCVMALELIGSSASAQTFTTLNNFGRLTNATGLNPSSPLVIAADGTLYGTSSTDERNAAGTVFRMQPDGSGFSVLKYFSNKPDGANPQAALVLSGSVLYGTTVSGGLGGGTVFKLNTDGTGFTVLKSFAVIDGASPVADLTLDGTVLYGTTTNGGSLGFPSYGTVFKINIDGTDFTVLKEFTGSDGAYPCAGLALADGALYGTTAAGGSSDAGTVFKLKTDGTGYTVLKHFAGFPTEGSNPQADLTLSDGVLYGTTSRGGSSDGGTVFKISTNGTDYAVLKFFEDLDGPPLAALALDGTLLYGTTSDDDFTYGTVFRLNTDGTDYAVLKEFSGSDGRNPLAGVRLSGNVLYGTTSQGGMTGQGTVFKVNTDGTDHAVLKHFTYGSDGRWPQAGLTPSGSVLYGTTYYGGSWDCGTVFAINTNGTGYTVLKQFTRSDGASPSANLTLSGNVLYGTTVNGGSSQYGTVFALNTDGTGYTVLKHFTGSDGKSPYARLTLSGSVLYGTTLLGGNSSRGTVFKLNADGTGYTILKHCTSSDGSYPMAGLTLSGGVLYGTTSGGPIASGNVFRMNTDGTGYTVLKYFTGSPGDAANPIADLMLSGGVLYGTTRSGGSVGQGTVFKVNTDGTGYTVLKEFYGYDGRYPMAGLILSGAVLYGTTSEGCNSGVGTVFQLSLDGSSFNVLKDFSDSDATTLYGGLVVSDTVLYGTTASGGSNGGGTVFKLDLSNLLPIPLTWQKFDGNLILSWSNPAFALQSAPEVTGTYTNIPGATSPYTNAWPGPQRFFRLIGN